MTTFNRLVPLLLVLFSLSSYCAQTELKDLSINGGVQDGKARLVIEAQLQGLTADKDKLLFSTTLQHMWQIARERHTHTCAASAQDGEAADAAHGGYRCRTRAAHMDESRRTPCVRAPAARAV